MWSPLPGGPPTFAEKRKRQGSCSGQGLSLCKSPDCLLLGIGRPDAIPRGCAGGGLFTCLEGLGKTRSVHLSGTGHTQRDPPVQWKSTGRWKLWSCIYFRELIPSGEKKGTNSISYVLPSLTPSLSPSLSFSSISLKGHLHRCACLRTDCSEGGTLKPVCL